MEQEGAAILCAVCSKQFIFSALKPVGRFAKDLNQRLCPECGEKINMDPQIQAMIFRLIHLEECIALSKFMVERLLFLSDVVKI
ncbi:hypothetical protein KKG18_02950 [Patescibacteria group bacterium]|nr:hypothetical protein [Patescibacteria group bacterium]